MGLNNSGNSQKRNSNETIEQFNIIDNLSNDIQYNNQDVMFNNINYIQTYSQSYLQESNVNIEEQSYIPLLDYNTSSYIQLQETENDFSYSNSSNYNKEILVNNTNQDILSNITVQQEERYNNPITHCINIRNKRMFDIKSKEETESKKQKHDENNKLNVIEYDPSNLLTPSTSINNTEKLADAAKVNYYLIDFNNNKKYNPHLF